MALMLRPKMINLLLLLFTINLFWGTSARSSGYYWQWDWNQNSIDKPSREEEFLRQKCRIPFHHELSHYRLDRRTRQCYPVGSQGPCGRNMIFYSRSGDLVYGVCVCRSGMLVMRRLLHDDKTDQCYPIFTKAFCPRGHWMTIDKYSKRPICERNPCQSLTDSSYDRLHRHAEYVLFNNKCVELGAPSFYCGRGEVIDFMWNRITPTCLKNSHFSNSGNEYFGNVSQKPESCPPGYYRSLSGGCQTNWAWLI